MERDNDKFIFRTGFADSGFYMFYDEKNQQMMIKNDDKNTCWVKCASFDLNLVASIQEDPLMMFTDKCPYQDMHS